MKFPNLSSPMVSAQGYVSRDWMILFQQLWAQAFGDAMAANMALFDPQQMQATPTMLYSNPKLATRLDKVTFTNTDSASRTVSVYAVPAGRSPDNTTALITAKSVSAGACYDATELEGHVINAGWSLQASADAADKVVVFASGAQISN